MGNILKRDFALFLWYDLLLLTMPSFLWGIFIHTNTSTFCYPSKMSISFIVCGISIFLCIYSKLQFFVLKELFQRYLYSLTVKDFFEEKKNIMFNEIPSNRYWITPHIKFMKHIRRGTNLMWNIVQVHKGQHTMCTSIKGTGFRK